MVRKTLTVAVCVGLMMPALIQVAHAQDPVQSESESEAEDLDRVVVTGSLIPQSQVETASPVISISAEDIQREGFKNVYDALRSLPAATGAVQDSQSTNSFTPGANTVSLLGLDPSFTLVLLNGRPLADYPFLYNGSSNFVDLATIPTFLVERVDILPGNQSAIYGSAAIAGVVNIVLKKDLDGDMASFRVGTYTDGGGSSQKFTFAGGRSPGNWDLLYGIEFSNQDPIYGYQRDYTDSTLDAPNEAGRAARRDRMARDAFTGLYVDPGQATCDAITHLFRGDLEYRDRSGFGNYCGSFNGNGNTTFMNGREDYTGYLSATYRFGGGSEFYADALYNLSNVVYQNDGTNFWALGVSGTGLYAYDIDSGHLVDTLQHFYAPEEIGDLFDGRLIQHSYVANVGVRGAFGDSDWDYDAYLHRSAFQSKFSRRRQLTDAVNEFFLGPQDGTDPFGFDIPAYHISQQGNLWGAVTPEELLSYTAVNVKKSETYAQNAGVTVVNTSLFDLPAGPIGFAGLAEFGNQYWDDPVDPRITAGEFWGSGGTSGRGRRNRQAIGAEVSVPVFSMLSASASARYDRYSAAGNDQGKATYKVGLEFRPIDSLLLRGNYATAFRAPDMSYVFTGGNIFFANNEDYYNCRVVQGDDYGDCDTPYDSVQFQGSSVANPDLDYITAKSYGFGVVWSPSSNFSAKADYYDIKIDNQVSNYSIDTILQREADCRLGRERDGTAVDGNSAECLQFIAQVTRSSLSDPLNPGQLLSVATVPINIAKESVSGITANITYRLDAGRFGRFTFAGDYNRTLKHEVQQFPTDEPLDYLDFTNSYEFRNIGSATVSWEKDQWAATVRGTRFGPSSHFNVTDVDNNPATPGVFLGTDPWIVYNASVQYAFQDDLTLSLIANNVTNERPPYDPTYTNYPYYNVLNYNSFGRLLMLEIAMKFGGGGA